MAWDDNLLSAQRIAASHVGTHARLLAGPGTGKTLTLTRRICFLIAEKNISTESIVALTFTRAAARELRQRVATVLGENDTPHISTLHSFALRQLLRNAAIIKDLPQPLRIADDWEERHIVLNDLKAMLKLNAISDARDLLNKLSADWQSLAADKPDWDQDPGFLGTWGEHRQIYGYTLRSELVYQLKKALEQRGDVKIEGPLKHLLVDEYQDLNRCDLEVVNQITLHSVELFTAGDDDQSIYGFRKADPEGIRKFHLDYSNVTSLELEICKRCDRRILELGLFIARQDPRHIPKAIQPEPDRQDGEVALLRFDDQTAESAGITNLCSYLMRQHNLKSDDILILLRSDRNYIFSRQIQNDLERAGIPAASGMEMAPLDNNGGRAFLAFLRLAVNIEDSLAWRTLLQVWCNGIGPRSQEAVYNTAHSRGENFSQTIIAAHDDAKILPQRHQSRLFEAINKVLNQLNGLFPKNSRDEFETYDELMNVIQPAAESIIRDRADLDSILSKIESTEATSINDLVQRIIGVEAESIEQDLAKDKVNILTMHRAKGLTAKAVIVAAAEREHIPGRAVGNEIDDERRLLYVSLTRAEHHLFVTYCDRRTGQQRYAGSDSGNTSRSLSPFLAICPHSYKPQDGNGFINHLTG